MSEQELKPCPFCGGILGFKGDGHETDCYIYMRLLGRASPLQLSEAWNRRAALPLLSDEQMPPLPDRDESIVHIYPSDLARMKASETTATAFSVAVGCPDELSTPLYTADQLRARDRAVEAAVRKQILGEK